MRSIEPAGRHAVVVRLKQPDASWPFVPAQYFSKIFQAKFAAAHKTTLGRPGVLIMGTGPWKYDRFDPTSGVELSGNPDWWGGRVPIERISIKFFANETGEALALRSREIDVALRVTQVRA